MATKLWHLLSGMWGLEEAAQSQPVPGGAQRHRASRPESKGSQGAVQGPAWPSRPAALTALWLGGELGQREPGRKPEN